MHYCFDVASGAAAADMVDDDAGANMPQPAADPVPGGRPFGYQPDGELSDGDDLDIRADGAFINI